MLTNQDIDFVQVYYVNHFQINKECQQIFDNLDKKQKQYPEIDS